MSAISTKNTKHRNRQGAKESISRAPVEMGLASDQKQVNEHKQYKAKKHEAANNLHRPHLKKGDRNYIILPIDLKSKRIIGRQGLHYDARNDEAERYIYISRTTATNVEDDEEREALERSIRVTGIPLSFSDSDVSECIGALAPVEAVFPSQLQIRTPGMLEYTAVLEDKESVDRVLTADNARVFVEPSGEVGMNKWAKEFFDQRPDFERLQTQVDTFLMAFDQRTEMEKKSSSGPIIDEDGFILVTNGKRNLTQAQIGASRRDAARQYRKKMLKKEEMVQSFYKFQEMERKQSKLAMLKKKFEEDRMKIQEMKASRKFKPF